MPTNIADFQNFARAVAARYSGRYAGYPFVRFYGDLERVQPRRPSSSPQFNCQRARSSAPPNYAKLAAAGYAGIKAGSPKRSGRDRRDLVERPRQAPRGRSPTPIAPATFAKGVAAGESKGVKFDAWAHAPVPVPASTRSRASCVTLPERDAARRMPRFEKDTGRRGSGARTSRSGSRSTATRRSPASRRASPRPSRPPTCPQALAMARKDDAGPDVHLVRAAATRRQQPLAERHLPPGRYTASGRSRSSRERPSPLDPVDGKQTFRGGTRNPKLTVYLRRRLREQPDRGDRRVHDPQLPAEQARPGLPGRLAARDRLHREAARRGARTWSRRRRRIASR